jgi:hypothetical protein
VRNLLWTLGLAVFVAGCATGLSRERLQHAEASIQNAEELGASKLEAAQVHLQLAKDQTAAAKRLAADGDARAERILERACLDAELAVSLAREALVHSAALAASEELREVLGWEAVQPAP